MNSAVFRHHARIVKTRDPLALRDLLLLSCTVTANLAYTRAVFDDNAASISDAFPWNTLIRAHSLVPHTSPHALSLFVAMRHRAVPHDSYTFPFLLRACAHHPSPRIGHRMGVVAHAILFKLGFFGSHVHVANALVSFYAGLGMVDLAVKAFGEMPRRDSVSWSALVECFVSNGLDYEALLAFRAMQVDGGDVDADEVTMVSVMTAVANVGVPELAVWVYLYVSRRGFELKVSMGTALVVMLSKCGYMDRAREVFDQMPVRNARTWTAVIAGLAEHGRSREAVDVYDRMLAEGTAPDHVMLVAVLTACSHGGLVEKGTRVFESIEKDFKMVPWMEHYGCVVDLLGRAERLEDAYGFISKMPVKPNAVIWRTLLGACVNHGRTELAEHVKEKIMELEPNHDGDYVLLSNVFGGTGRWLEKARVRLQMKDRGISKTPAWSESYC